MEKSESALKMEINFLIARVEQLTKENQEKVEKINALNSEIEQMAAQFPDSPDSGSETLRIDQSQKNKLRDFLMDFCRIATAIMENQAYIPYSYATKYSEHYYKIEQGVFENYVEKYSELELKPFLRFCVDLQLVKAEANKKCVYSSGNIHVYYVSRLFMDTAAMKEDQELQEA